MEITDVQCFLTEESGPAVFVKVSTNAGITGYGDASNHFVPQAVAGMISDLRPMLIGQDPERIEYIWQMCFRSRFMRGGPATGSAIGGIDMALWDIKAKKLGVPVYQLLGGKARERVRLYGHAGGMTAQEIAENAAERVSRGITAVRFRGFHDADRKGIHDHRRGVYQQEQFTRAIREAVGDDTDIIVECHGRYDVEWAVELAGRLEQYRPFFLEDPIRHENAEVFRELRKQIRIPLATGERGHSKWELKDLIVKNAVNYLRPDICHCGGFTEMRKIAALAETYYINLVLHNNAGPLGTAASLHACLAIPNVALLEAPWVNRVDHERRITWPYPDVQEGFALPLEKPGLGIEFDEKAAGLVPFKPSNVPVLRGLDGSIRDW